MTKFSFAALAALLLAGGFSTTLYAQAPPSGQPYIQVPIPQIPGVTPQPRGTRATIGSAGSAGSTASASETGNMSFAIVWRMRRATVKSGNDWSIGFVK
jgi:hypothetical protein